MQPPPTIDAEAGEQYSDVQAPPTLEESDGFITEAYLEIRDYVQGDLPHRIEYDPVLGIFNYDDTDHLMRWFALMATIGIHEIEIHETYPVTQRYATFYDEMMDVDVLALASNETEADIVEDIRELASVILCEARTGTLPNLARLIRDFGAEGFDNAIVVALLRAWIVAVTQTPTTQG